MSGFKLALRSALEIWSSKKQINIALSNANVEYRGVEMWHVRDMVEDIAF